jgi:tetratricopeptide (TPR) repeat protein
MAWAGGRAGENYACQGNKLVDENTVNAMARTFEETTGPLATRLLRALRAGEDAGGDSRGKQSAAIYIAKEGGGYQGLNDRYIDLRVDDHENPITELQRLLSIQLAYQALYRAMTMKEAGDIPGAICELECAKEACPGVAYLHYDLACYYSLSGRKSRALEELEKAISIAPEYKKMAVEDTDLQEIRGEAKFEVLTR